MIFQSMSNVCNTQSGTFSKPKPLQGANLSGLLPRHFVVLIAFFCLFRFVLVFLCSPFLPFLCFVIIGGKAKFFITFS